MTTCPACSRVTKDVYPDGLCRLCHEDAERRRLRDKDNDIASSRDRNEERLRTRKE